MMNDPWRAPLATRASKSAPCSPIKPLVRTRSESFHITHKIPLGDTPYVKAKRVQLVDKDPEKAIVLFWAAINAGDRVDSALKDMAIVMKQTNRAEEAIEAIKSLRNRCSDQAQESLDNILLDLYKRCGRLEDQIALLKHKLYMIHQGMAFNGKPTKTARSQGKKFQVSVEQETTRLLGNLGWAFMQQQNYIKAEAAYRKALSMASDNNKMCNLGICLMKQGRVAEAKETLQRVKPAMADGPRGVDSHLKAYERAQEMLRDIESQSVNGQDRFLEAFLGSSSVWQPQPCPPFPYDSLNCKDPFDLSFGKSGFELPDLSCLQNLHDSSADENFNINIMNRGRLENLEWKDSINPSFRKAGFGIPDMSSRNPLEDFSERKDSINPSFGKAGFGIPDLSCSWNPHEEFADENLNIMNIEGSNNLALPPLQKSVKQAVLLRNSLNIDAPPFYSKLVKNQIETLSNDPLCKLKRSRSLSVEQENEKVAKTIAEQQEDLDRGQPLPVNLEENHGIDFLPDSEEFERIIIAAAIAPFVEAQKNPADCQRNIKKRLKSFQEMTLPLSPKA